METIAEQEQPAGATRDPADESIQGTRESNGDAKARSRTGKAKSKVKGEAAKRANSAEKPLDPYEFMSTDRVMSNSESLRISYDNGDYPYPSKMRTTEYMALKAELQAELLKVQNWVRMSGQRIVGIFEGRDAAGKGGAIKRFMEHLNPRAAHVVALEKPNEREQGQWYFQRYIQNLPTRGELVFFDRSWYNRTGVERVMGFCSPTEYLEFLRQTPQIERMLVNSGITLFKFWFSVSRYEQLRRFHSRKLDPLKQWKLSPIDIESLAKWEDYTKAKESMFFYTDTADAPWTVIKSDDKKRARINCMRYFLNKLDYPDKDVSVIGKPDPKIVGPASRIYEKDEHPYDAELHLSDA